ncbi:MAG: hypothetical protein JW876_02795 [Candidatus Krumholzibacteriota bacterium]|nr:hypothetical protein [Candidatus Krumholzibacteriota bacterium]
MMKRSLLLLLVATVALGGCTFYNRVIDKDLSLDEMDALKEKYTGRTGWTRSLLDDLGPEGVIDRDVEVTIVDIDFHWTGAVTVSGPGRVKIRHGLEIERPMTLEKFEEKMNRLFWFKEPDYRYRMNLRAYGKKTAKAIYNHELFKDMTKEAALESWGYPDETRQSEISGSVQEQWIYKDPRQKNKKRYIYILDGKVDRWEE